MTWVDLSAAFAYGTKLTSTQMGQLRDNIAAAFAKDSGAPVLADSYVVTDMIAALAVSEAKLAASAVTSAKIADANVTSAKLKTIANTTGASGSLAVNASVVIAMQDYCLFPNIYASQDGETYVSCYDTSTVDTTARLGLTNKHETNASSYVVRWRYVTASDHPYLYALQDRKTGEILHMWACDDPPPGYWGRKDWPADGVAPIRQRGLDMAKYQEIVLFEQDGDFLLELGEKARADKKTPALVLGDDYEYDAKIKLFRTKNLAEI